MSYEPNSQRSKAAANASTPAGAEKPANDKPEKNIEKVVTAEVIQRKPSVGRRFKTVFFGGEFSGAMRYVAADVLLPAFRNLMVDTATKGVERLVYGESRMQRGRPMEFGGRVRYSTPVSRPPTARLPDQAMYARPRRDDNQIIIATRDEAERVLERMFDIVETYGVASVADLHELTGLPSSAVDNRWGWTNLKTAEVRQIRDGFLLDLPTSEEL